MVKLFAEAKDKHDDFFEQHYIADQGFFIKGKAKKFEGKISLKDNQPTLEAKFEESGKIQDSKVKGEVTLRSSSEHELETDLDLSKHVEKTKLSTHANWNSLTHDYDGTVSLHNKHSSGIRNKFDFHFVKGGDWTLTHNFSKKLCKRTILNFDFTWDGKKSGVVATNLGFWIKPTKWMSAFITHSTEGQINKKTDWKKLGVVTWRSRFTAADKTKLGFDYSYDLSTRTAGLLLGVETSPADGLDVKAKINSEGDLEAAAKLEIADKWDLIMASSMKAANITGGQASSFGFGLEGKLK